ncbi:hypothetical protein K1719_006883 [Acacia pycnantha]|nr:hypothetical protein K1719_006883 [Acacia pycnantha]
MHQNQFIAAIFILFLANAVAGLPFTRGHHRHGGHHRHSGHHRFHHRRPAMPGSTSLISPATPVPKIPFTAPIPTIPRIPVPPPATPQTPVTEPAEPPPPSNFDEIFGKISKHAKMFGWDPMKAIKACDPSSDLLKCLRKLEFLVAHNWVRLQFKLPLFTWDEKLESAAKQTAMQHYDDCKMVHSDFPYGENIFWAQQLHWTPSDAVYYWYNESSWYNLTSLQCSAPVGKDCGHFTQVAWKDSVRLGCALQHCRDPTKGMLIFCEYDPPGNFDNENPLDDNNAKYNKQN